MARTINAARTDTTTRRKLGGYHWILLFLVIGATLLVSAPTLFGQPQLYFTTAAVQIDAERYQAFINDEVTRKQLYAVAGGAVKQTLPGYGNQWFGAKLAPVSPEGVVIIEAHATTAQEAQVAADEMAKRLVQQVRGAAGRDVLRQLMDVELYLLLQNQPAADEIGVRVRQLIGAQAFEFAPHATPDRPRLDTEAYNDMIRALQIRSDELSTALRQADLPQARRRDLLSARRAADTFLTDVLYPQVAYSDVAPSAAYISQTAVLPLEPRSQRLALKLGLVLLVGSVGGLVLVFADRAIGIVAKVQELWRFRELTRNLVARDLKSRYKSSALGYVWSLLNPLLMITLFYFVFAILLKSQVTYFHIFLMVALLPWNFFIGSVSEGMGSIIGNGNLVKKVYFPREILPIAVVISNLINFLLSLPVLFIVILLTGADIRSTALLLPIFIVIQSVFVLGVVLFLSSLAVFYRDTTHIMGIVLQLWFFVTPIFYPLENIGNPIFAKLVRWTNPMASLVDFYRDILYGGLVTVPNLPTPGLPSLDGVARTALTSLVVLVIGAYVFHRFSGRFGEEL